MGRNPLARAGEEMIIPTIILLAASCIGEAGWDAHETGECAAIIYVYKTRADLYGVSVRSMVSKYSSPLKTRTKPWLMHLNKEGTCPKHFPKNLSWKKYKKDWLDTLTVAEQALHSQTRNPTPGAEHFGMHSDKKFLGTSSSLGKSIWVRINTPGLKNHFYRRR